MEHANRAYLWLDMETTGDRPDQDDVLEIGWFFTDCKLNLILNDSNGSWFVQPRAGWEQMMLPVVHDMHIKSGLLAEYSEEWIANRLPPLSDIETLILQDWKKVRDDHPEITELVLAGSGVSQLDMPFIKRKMTRLSDALMYFMLDIGQVRRFLRDVVGVHLTEQQEAELQTYRGGAHRAYDDALAHWLEARFWAGVIEGLATPLAFFSPIEGPGEFRPITDNTTGAG